MIKQQEGIYWAKKSTPGRHFGIMFLRANSSAGIEKVYYALKDLWSVYQDLKKGLVQDLPGIALPVPASGLAITIGYGKNIFKIAGVKKSLPVELDSFGNFRSPAPSGGGKLLSGSGLSYAISLMKNPATEDIVLQFICDSEVLICRSYIETWKKINKINTENSENVIETGRFFTGFQREDRRSWIDFHDGISNIPSGNERLSVIEIKDTQVQQDKWTEKGTYLAFMRIGIDLAAWNKFGIKEQETFVGRKKISGCPLMNVDNGNLIPVSGCPVEYTDQITGKDQINKNSNTIFFEPPIIDNSLLNLSHVQRANHHRLPLNQRDSLRIFRQGYEFFETIDEAPGFRAGLNFISFQDTPERLLRILTQPSWLGNINFGGDENDQPAGIANLLSIFAGGIYLVPPVNDAAKIPGYEIFE